MNLVKTVSPGQPKIGGQHHGSVLAFMIRLVRVLHAASI
jgi:hypothetical protein